MIGCLNFGKIYWKLDEFFKVIEFQKKVLSFVEKMKSLDKMGLCYYDFGIFYLKFKEFEMVCDYLEKCIELCVEVR